MGFGKSSLLSIIEELYSNGLSDLFAGLKIKEQGLYQSDKTYDVLHLNFATENAHDAMLFGRNLIEQIVHFVESNRLDDVDISRAQEFLHNYTEDKYKGALFVL